MTPSLSRGGHKEFGEGGRRRVAPYHTVSVVVHHGKFRWLMSAKGQERPICGGRAGPALPLKATKSLRHSGAVRPSYVTSQSKYGADDRIA